MKKKHLSLLLTMIIASAANAQSINIGGIKIQNTTGNNNEQSINIGKDHIKVKNNDVKIDIGSAESNNNITITSNGNDVSVGSYCDITKKLNNANCENKNFLNVQATMNVSNTDFAGATFTSINADNAQITNSDFEDAVMSDVSFKQSQFRNTDFDDATLTNIDFDGSRFTNTDFEDAILTNVTFKNTNLEPAMLSGASLTNVKLPNGVICPNTESCTKLIEE